MRIWNQASTLKSEFLGTNLGREREREREREEEAKKKKEEEKGGGGEGEGEERQGRKEGEDMLLLITKAKEVLFAQNRTHVWQFVAKATASNLRFSPRRSLGLVWLVLGLLLYHW
jgi:hypothetical protein